MLHEYLKHTHHLPKIDPSIAAIVLPLTSGHLHPPPPSSHLLSPFYCRKVWCALQNSSCNLSSACTGQFSSLQPCKACDKNSGCCVPCGGVKFVRDALIVVKACSDLVVCICCWVTATGCLSPPYAASSHHHHHPVGPYTCAVVLYHSVVVPLSVLNGNFLLTQRTASHSPSIQQFCRGPLKAEEKADWLESAGCCVKASMCVYACARMCLLLMSRERE